MLISEENIAQYPLGCLGFLYMVDSVYLDNTCIFLDLFYDLTGTTPILFLKKMLTNHMEKKSAFPTRIYHQYFCNEITQDAHRSDDTPLRGPLLRNELVVRWDVFFINVTHLEHNVRWQFGWQI